VTRETESSTPLEVQLQRDGGACFAATLSTVLSSQGGSFKARGN